MLMLCLQIVSKSADVSTDKYTGELEWNPLIEQRFDGGAKTASQSFVFFS